MSNSPFLTSLRQRMMAGRYSLRTIDTYTYWIKHFILFSGKRHPDEMHNAEVALFLSYLSNQRRVSISTQKTALNALAYLYNKHLNKPLDEAMHFNRATVAQKLPIVLSIQEVAELLNRVRPPHKLPAQMLYGSGLRLRECISLRVQDIDFNYHSVRIWNSKGRKHRIVTLAAELIPDLRQQGANGVRSPFSLLPSTS